MHRFFCVVHSPIPQRCKPEKFKKTPNKVTEENKMFWNEDLTVGGSICKECYDKYLQRKNILKHPSETLSDDSKVYKEYFNSFLEGQRRANRSYSLFKLQKFW